MAEKPTKDTESEETKTEAILNRESDPEPQAETVEKAKASAAVVDDTEEEPKSEDEANKASSAAHPKKIKAKSRGERTKNKTRDQKTKAKARENRKHDRDVARANRLNKKAAKQRKKEREKRIKQRGGGNTNRRNMWLLILTTLLVIGSVFMFMPPQEKINQGLDIQGGLSVVLSAQSTDGSEITQEDLETSRSIIESRVNALGASEATVQIQGNNQILVQIPGLSDTQTALETIGRTGVLEFARADSFTDQADQTAIQNGTYIQQGTVTDEFGNSFPSGEVTYRDVTGSYTPLITGENITRVTVDRASETSSYGGSV